MQTFLRLYALASLILEYHIALAHSTNHFKKDMLKLPNFLVLFVDDMGINQIQIPGLPSIYGYTGDNGTIETPNLARMAQEGLLFQTWYSSFHVCSPSRASIMTGRYSIRSGIGLPPSTYAPKAPGPSAGGNKVLTAEAIGGLPLNETTTAEALKTVGYATAMVGKWHIGVRPMYLPTARGFDEYLGIPFSQDMGISFWKTNDYKPSRPYQPTPLPLLNGVNIVEQPTDLSTLVGKYVNFTSSFISRNAKKRIPFYMYVSFNHIHQPNSCGSAFCGRSKRGPIGDAVEEMDWAVGQILKILKESQVDNNTLIIFTSDNGAPLGGDKMGNLPLRGGKSQTWEGGFREPAIVRWPGRIQPGRVTQGIASTMDIHTTLLKLAGVSLPTDRVIDGIDLSPLLFNTSLDQNPNAGHECYMFYNSAAAVAASKELYAVRCGAYKAFWTIQGGHVQNPPLLFNLEKDPSETEPVRNSSEEYKTAMQKLTKARTAHLSTITPVPDQNGRGSNNTYAFCATSFSLANWPACTLTPENWTPKSICNSKKCLSTNPSFASTCTRPPPPTCPGPHCPPVQKNQFKGCYHDHHSGVCDLSVPRSGHCADVSVPQYSGMTIEICNAWCVGYAYFGVQNGGTGCFCGKSYGSQGIAPPSTCNMTCAGNKTEICGGPNLNSVYQTVV